MTDKQLLPSDSQEVSTWVLIFMIIPEVFMIIPEVVMIIPEVFMIIPEVFMIIPEVVIITPEVFTITPSMNECFSNQLFSQTSQLLFNVSV